MGKVLPMFCILSVLVALFAHQGDSFNQEVIEELESEMQLKRMLAYVTPLMAIIRKDHRIRRSEGDEEAVGEEGETGRQYYNNYQPAYSKNGGYGGYSSGSSYGGGYSSCCQKKDDLLPLLALLGLAGLLLYLILIASTTTTRSGRRKRDINDNDVYDNMDMTSDYDQGKDFNIESNFAAVLWVR